VYLLTHTSLQQAIAILICRLYQLPMIEKILDKMCEDQSENFSSYDVRRIHAIEAARCTRLSYFERKDPLLADNAEKISKLLKQGVRYSFKNVDSEYKVDDLTLGVTADLVLNNEFIVKFEVVSTLPEMPHPRDLLYINACLFGFKKLEGILVYITYEGKFEEFTVTKSNRMFEEIIRRAKVLSTLLTESKLPIVEPSEICLTCKYYGRCYNREKKGSSYSLENLFAFRKKDGNHATTTC
jgi:CRISPR-associated exonuclease Cas4